LGSKFIIDKHWTTALKILRALAVAWLTASLMAAMLLVSSPISCHAQSPEELILYQENFDDGQAQGWQLEPGWAVDSSRLNGRDQASARYTAGYWGYGRVTLKFLLLSVQGDMRANFRMSQTGYYAVGFNYTGYCLEKEILNIYLYKVSGPDQASTTLAQSTIHYDQVWENIEIVTEGGNIRVYLKEAAPEFELYRSHESQEGKTVTELPVIDYIDSAPLPSGTIGFETLEGSTTEIDDIVVTGPAQPEPPIPPTPERPPDLTICSAGYSFENDGRAVVFSIGINNLGYVRTPETLLYTGDQEHVFSDRTSPVPGVSPGETVTLQIRQELTEGQYGSTYIFLFEVDPEKNIPEINEENNRQTLEVSVPVQGGGPSPWWWTILVVIPGGAGGYLVKRWSDRRQAKMPERLQVRPHKDIGSQQIESAAPFHLDYEVRLRSVIDYGVQTILLKEPLTGKRRQK
jgi:hypothetical protein